MSSLPASADEADVLDVKITKSGMYWRVSVTLQHNDSGWDHYADGWQVVDAEGNVLGTRELMHPHVEEMPFTRSLGHVVIPDGATQVFIRTRCNKDGWHDTLHPVDLATAMN